MIIVKKEKKLLSFIWKVEVKLGGRKIQPTEAYVSPKLLIVACLSQILLLFFSQNFFSNICRVPLMMEEKPGKKMGCVWMAMNTQFSRSES